MSLKPIVLYSAASGPNSWKVAIILKELDLQYETKYQDYRLLHQKPYEDINPNGRAPAIHDPNTDLTLWESNACIEYLIMQYDKERKISHDTFSEKHLEKQYMYFQASGQGPYFGQAAWFYQFHPEPVQSAKERYANEVKRVVAVLDGILASKKYIVGERLTYVDLSYVMWNTFIPMCLEPGTWDISAYPNFKRWHEEMLERDSVKTALKERDSEMAASQPH